MYRAGSRQSNLDLCPPVHRPASHTKAYHAARHTRSERGDAAHASVGGRATWSHAGPWIEAAVGSVALATRRPRRHVVASSRTTRATKSPTTTARRYPRPQAARAPAQAGLRTTVSYGMGAMRTPWASHAPPWSWDEGRASAMTRGAMRHARVTRAAQSWHGGATLEAGARTRSGTQISAAAMARPSLTRTWSACQDPAPTGPWASLDHPARASTDPCRTRPAAAGVAYRCPPALVARGHGWRCVGRSNRSARFPRTRLDASHVHASVAATPCPIPTTVVVDRCCAGPCQTVCASCRRGAEATCAAVVRRRPCLPIGQIGLATLGQRARGIYGGRLWGGATCARTQHRHAKAARERQSSHTKTACIDVSYADTAQVRDAPVSVASVPMSARM